MHRSRWYVRSQNLAAQCLFVAMLDEMISNWIVPVPLGVVIFVGLGLGVGTPGRGAPGTSGRSMTPRSSQVAQ
jgi:hypothetical protein